jgi:4-aminobutyrate aminotransferase
LAVAASLAVLETIKNENLCEQAQLLGKILTAQLNDIAKRAPQIAEVRGPGFMSAVEFRDPDSDAPLTAMANKVKDGARERGLILLTCGTDGNVIRFLAPLTIEQDVFDEAMDILEAAIIDAQKVTLS